MGWRMFDFNYYNFLTKMEKWLKKYTLTNKRDDKNATSTDSSSSINANTTSSTNTTTQPQPHCSTTTNNSGSGAGDSLVQNSKSPDPVNVNNSHLESSPKVNTSTSFDLNQINRPILHTYPKTDGRSFQKTWYDRFDWLEYHKEKDAAFCYPCRVYGINETKEDSFTTTGFNKWKNALAKGKGFFKHQSGSAHITNVSKLQELNSRLNKNAEISTLVSESVLEKNRYYLSSIFDVIRFIVSHELPLRGDNYDVETHSERGIFRDFFDFTLAKDKYLATCAGIIPKNATYLSPEMQNEIISTMASYVKSKISETVNNADVPFYTIMVDGTRDKNNNEAISICLRYVKNGFPTESLLSFENASALTAEYCANLVLDTLRKNGIDPSNMLSQCYDGASVMSGSKGGVQTLIQNELRRDIPYVHCFNHQLHLIVVQVVSEISSISQFFDYCRVIHKIFSTFKFLEFYDGNSTSRLMEHRWIGHLKTADIIYQNYEKMLDALNACIDKHEKEVDGYNIVECRGLLTTMKTEHFRFTLRAVIMLLRSIKPADKILQTEACGLTTAMPIIKSVHDTLVSYRTDEKYNELLTDARKLYPEESLEDDEPVVRPKRKILPNRRLDAFIVTESSGIYSEAAKVDGLKQQYFEMLDMTISEFDRRFSSNSELINVIDSMYEFDVEKYAYLKKFNICIPSKEEAACVKQWVLNNKFDRKNLLSELFQVRNAFGDMYRLFASLTVFGCSTATCEASFSTITRILRPQRQSMTFSREANLAFLSFERQMLDEIKNEELLRYFNSIKNRKLQLY